MAIRRNTPRNGPRWKPCVDDQQGAAGCTLFANAHCLSLIGNPSRTAILNRSGAVSIRGNGHYQPERLRVQSAALPLEPRRGAADNRVAAQSNRRYDGLLDAPGSHFLHRLHCPVRARPALGRGDHRQGSLVAWCTTATAMPSTSSTPARFRSSGSGPYFKKMDEARKKDGVDETERERRIAALERKAKRNSIKRIDDLLRYFSRAPVFARRPLAPGADGAVGSRQGAVAEVRPVGVWQPVAQPPAGGRLAMKGRCGRRDDAVDSSGTRGLRAPLDGGGAGRPELAIRRRGDPRTGGAALRRRAHRAAR